MLSSSTNHPLNLVNPVVPPSRHTRNNQGLSIGGDDVRDRWLTTYSKQFHRAKVQAPRGTRVADPAGVAAKRFEHTGYSRDVVVPPSHGGADQVGLSGPVRGE